MIPSMFLNMGLTYIGPIDGHNINHMTEALKAASKVNKAVVVHVVTRKVWDTNQQNVNRVGFMA